MKNKMMKLTKEDYEAYLENVIAEDLIKQKISLMSIELQPVILAHLKKRIAKFPKVKKKK